MDASPACTLNLLGFERNILIPQKEWLYDHYVDHICYDITTEEWSCLKSSHSMGVSR